MLDGPSVASALCRCGVTHVVWIPDSDLGTWEPALKSAPGLSLVRVCREGEAFGVAAGLHLGGKKPIILLQCTGLFEAGDTLRNVLHDMRLPLFMVIGIRSYFAHLKSASTDTCPVFAEAIVRAWQVPYQIFDESKTAQDLADAYLKARAERRGGRTVRRVMVSRDAERSAGAADVYLFGIADNHLITGGIAALRFASRLTDKTMPHTDKSNSFDVLSALIARQDLPDELVEELVEEIVSGRCDDGLAAAFLMGLRMKGESAGEIAAAARVLRRHMIRWHPGRDDVLDTCGTGGDHAGTFNISTATALVVAGAGVPVVKHGNRSASSRSGSADVLSALGVVPQGDPAHARRCLDETGLAFCFAPLFHPILNNVASLRRRLGIPTLFNCLGPLANPAGASRQLLGVGRADLLERMAQALWQLGTVRSLVVHGQDGLDEVTLGGVTMVRAVFGTHVQALEWTAADFGLPRCTLEDWHAEDPAASARIIEDVLTGRPGPCTWVVQANAAAALWLAERVPDLPSGVRLAQDALTTGKARHVLDKFRALCKDEVQG